MTEEAEDEVNEQPESRLEDETYRGERQTLNLALIEQSKAFDKAILTLSGGALGLSLIFIKDIVVNPMPWTKLLLGGSWAAFSLAILLMLVSMLISQKAIRLHLDNLEELRAGTSVIEQNKSAKYTGIINVVSILSFLVGVLLLASFSWQNLF